MRHVASSGIDRPVGQRWGRRPREPLIGAVLASVAISKVDELAATGHIGGGFDRGLAVIGMDKADEGLAQQFPILVSERLGPRLVQHLEVAVDAGQAEHVHGKVEESLRW